MSIQTFRTPENIIASDVEALRPSWGWLLALGIALLVLGAIALGSLPFVTAAYVLYLGFLLIASGIVSGIQAFRTRHWGGFFLALLIGILDVVVGFLMVTHVGETAAIMTLLLAVYFFVGGLFRIVVSLVLRFPQWGTSLLAGVVALLLGVSIWRQWPLDSFWVIGLFVGVELLFRGWSLVMLALAVRPRAGEPQQLGV
jgi:uncharacterized membrane protein HdeD (DUF308 family)